MAADVDWPPQQLEAEACAKDNKDRAEEEEVEGMGVENQQLTLSKPAEATTTPLGDTEAQGGASASSPLRSIRVFG